VAGVSRLLQECTASTIQERDPQAVMDYLITAVDAFGQGGIRDDIALLVGIVNKAPIAL